MRMNLRLNIRTCCFLLSMILLCSNAQASDVTRSETGRLKIASGIVLTSVFSTAGLLAVMAYGMGACSDSEYERCQSELVLGGAAAVGVGLGFGIPLIVSGARDRKAFKSQNRAENFEPEARSPIGINLFVNKAKTSMLNFTYDL